MRAVTGVWMTSLPAMRQAGATMDLKSAIDDLSSDGYISATDDYLTSIQIGWEIIEGGTFRTNDFWTALQDEVSP